MAVSNPSPPAPPVPLVANSTANSALPNSTGILAAAASPATSGRRQLIASLTLVVTTLETGGAVTLDFVSGGTTVTVPVFAGGAAAGTYTFSFTGCIDQNTTWHLNQTSALSAGAATLTWNIGVF